MEPHTFVGNTLYLNVEFDIKAGSVRNAYPFSVYFLDFLLKGTLAFTMSSDLKLVCS